MLYCIYIYIYQSFFFTVTHACFWSFYLSWTFQHFLYLKTVWDYFRTLTCRHKGLLEIEKKNRLNHHMLYQYLCSRTPIKTTFVTRLSFQNVSQHCRRRMHCIAHATPTTCLWNKQEVIKMPCRNASMQDINKTYSRKPWWNSSWKNLYAIRGVVIFGHKRTNMFWD